MNITLLDMATPQFPDKALPSKIDVATNNGRAVNNLELLPSPTMRSPNSETASPVGDERLARRPNPPLLDPATLLDTSAV